MPLREKHTSSFWAVLKFFYNRKDIISLLIAIVLLLILTSGFAASQDVQKVYTTEDATIVYSADDNNKVVITEGKITAFEGRTIRLLPGTHIKSSAQLMVNIASKECQEAVAREVAKEEENLMLASAAKKLEEVLPRMNTVVAPFIFKNNALPEEKSFIGQQTIFLTAALTTTTLSFNAPVITLHKRISDSNSYKPEVLATQMNYTPVYSWGECAETIKVMRN